MSRFRKKPVVIDAWQYKGDDDMETREIPDWLIGALGNRVISAGPSKDTLTVNTSEGDMLCSKDDWIIKGIEGELYPCKPSVFDLTYDPVEVETGVGRLDG